MLFSIPIYVEERPAEGAKPPSFIARPLFFKEPFVRAEKLSRALSRLETLLREELKDLGEEPRHTKLARWAFSPPIDDTVRELRLDLAKPTRRDFFLAGYAALNRKLYFTPKIPGLLFDVLPGQDLAERAREAIERHLRDLEKEHDSVDLDEFAIVGKARLTVIEINLNPATLAKKPEPERRAFVFGRAKKMDGERELRKVGRPLHSMYPDDLDRAAGRDHEVAELAALLAAADRRPIVLVGPRKVGKTTILHELAFQIAARKKERFAGKREIWLVSPMRLISGMSVVGEWENRVIAILDHVEKKESVLYFDDLLGLFSAGVSSASNLNVAQTLLPALEKRSVRVIAECTPEAWRVLRERDRRFADLFQVMPVREPTHPETMQALVNIVRHLEDERNCQFHVDVVPLTFELCRRHLPEAAFPGKAAAFLKTLATRSAGAEISGANALAEFSAQTGLQLKLLDDSVSINRDEVLSALRSRVIGQDGALNAFADVFLILKTRLNDPRRPLGVMLLLGPTGVGKTQAAKALAATLFGGDQCLLRFDMNEYVDASAVARLAGTPRDPEGLLTGAIRRQPFSVVLFDEIEKAAPEAFDLLLAVLDEGRLTDSLGRVADFTQSVILLTSNLGASEARSRLGFGAESNERAEAHYISAAEKFFRPEFFNRLTHVIPFHALGREALEGIARHLLDDLFARDGLRRRDTILDVSPEAIARLVTLGHHPQLGARALRRVVEREVGQPVAAKLASIPAGAPLVASLTAAADQFHLSLRELIPAPRSIAWPDEIASRPRAEILDAVCDALDRIDAALGQAAPTGSFQIGELSPQQARYLFAREQFGKVQRFAESLQRRAAQSSSTSRAKIPKARPLKLTIRQRTTVPTRDPRLGRLRSAVALQGELDDVETEWLDASHSPLISLVGELSWLDALVAETNAPRRGLLVFRAMSHRDSPTLFQLEGAFEGFLDHLWGIKVISLFKLSSPAEVLLKATKPEAAPRILTLYVEGPGLERLFPHSMTVMQVRHRTGAFGMVTTEFLPAASEAEARPLAKKLRKNGGALDLANLGPVTHLASEGKPWLDYRTGIAIPESDSADEFRAAFLAGLPLAPELSALFPRV